MRPERIPLFPLNVVLLPGADLPLHIFEPRYREMVNLSLKRKSEFGMLLSLPKGVVKVGCTAAITKVVKRYDDGRMDILTVGRSPFRVVELFTANPLLEGRIDYLDDHETASDAPMRRELIDLYETCHTLIYGRYPENIASESSQELSYAVAASLPLELLWKQQILELRTESDRQGRLLGYLREWAAHLQNKEIKRHKAAGNGSGWN